VNGPIPRDPKDAGAAQEKFPFLVSSVMATRIFVKQELSPQCSSGEVPVPRLTCHVKENLEKGKGTNLRAAWIRKLVPRWTTHVKQILVLGDTQPPVQLTIRGLVQTPAGDGTMIPEAWCFFIFFLSVPTPRYPCHTHLRCFEDRAAPAAQDAGENFSKKFS